MLLAAILLELPVAVVERTDLAGLQPPRDAVEVEGVLSQTRRQPMSSLSLSLWQACPAGVLTLQIPQATVHSSLVAEAWLAWHSMPAVSTVRRCGPNKET